MRKLALAGAALAAPAVALVLILVAVLAGPVATGNLELARAGECLTPGAGGNIEALDGDQERNARAIVAEGLRLRIPTFGLVVAIATARQESGIRNLASRANPDSLNYPHDGVADGDHDSVGLFQQRDAWGPMSVRMNPTASARMFFTGGQAGQRGLLDIPGWQDMQVWEAAQAVQVSAFPTAYAQWTNLAVQVIKRITGGAVADACRDEPRLAGPWTLPIPKGQYRLSAGFGECGALWSSCHTGLDLAAPSGTPVRAVAAGRVVSMGEGGAYGHHLLKIDHGGGVQSWYAHMSAAIPGGSVRPGQVVGRVGVEGNTTGPHLHLEIRVKGAPVDPAAWLTKRGVRP